MLWLHAPSFRDQLQFHIIAMDQRWSHVATSKGIPFLRPNGQQRLIVSDQGTATSKKVLVKYINIAWWHLDAVGLCCWWRVVFSKRPSSTVAVQHSEVNSVQMWVPFIFDCLQHCLDSWHQDDYMTLHLPLFGLTPCLSKHCRISAKLCTRLWSSVPLSRTCYQYNINLMTVQADMLQPVLPQKGHHL